MRQSTKVVYYFFSLGLFVTSLLGLGLSVSAQFSGSDLVVASLSVEPVQPEPDTVVNLVAVIANTGRDDILQGFSIRFFMDDVYFTERRINFGLDSKKEQQVSAPWMATAGDHVFRVQIDPFNDVDEASEFNNSAEQSISVRRPGAIRSITYDLVDSVSVGLSDAGASIQLEFSTDTLALVNSFQKAFQAASNAFEAGASKIDALAAPLPAELQSEGQIGTSAEIALLYGSLAASLTDVASGLLNLNLTIIPDAFGQVIDDMRTLSGLSVEGIRFAKLSETIPLFEAALEQAALLEDALSGKQVNINAVTQELVNLLSEIGRIWIDVGGESAAAAQSQTSRHQNSQGQTIVSYRAGDELSISVENASQMKLEVFDASGKLVYSKEVEGNQLVWMGVGNDGKTLPSERYFGRLIVTNSEGQTFTDLLQIIIG